MKQLLLLLSTVLLLGSCMPYNISSHEKKHWRYQKRVKGYYYRTYPFYQQKRIKSRVYTPYFMPGKF